MSKKVTDLTALTSVASDDVLPIVDISAGTTKKSTIANIIAGGASSIPNNSVSAPMLATSSITLGYTQITSNFTTAAQVSTQVTSLSVSVTIPAGGRKVEITFHAPNCFVNALGSSQLEIWDGTVGSGTRLAYGKGTSAGASYSVPITIIAVVTPSAGSKTYNASYYVDSNSGTLSAAATAPAFLLVKMI